MDQKPKAPRKTRWSKETAIAHSEGCRDGGLSKRRYADERGIDYARLVWWSRNLQGKNVQPTADFQFLPVTVKREGQGEVEADLAAIEVVLKGKRVVRVRDMFNPAVLQAVVQALEAIC